MHRVPRAGWTLAIDECPTHHDTISGRTPPGWRGWGQDVLQPTHADRYAFADAVIERVLQRAGHDPNRWADIIGKYPTMPPARRKEALTYLQQHADELRSSNGSTELWAKTRNLLHHHRSFPDAAWALPSEELDALTALYEHLCPDDPIAANAWLFDHWPHLPQAERRDYRDSQAQFEHARSSALQKLLGQHDQGIISGLVRASPAPLTVGWTFALVVAGLDELIEFILPHISDNDVRLREFAKGAMLCLHNQRGTEALDYLLKKAKSARLAAYQIAEIYGTALPDRKIWARLETEADDVASAYWSGVQNAYPRNSNQDDIEYAFEHLLDAHRAHDVSELLSLSDVSVASNLVIRALKLLPVELKTRRDDGRRVSIDGYRISKALERLDQLADVPRPTIAKLEVPFVGSLEHYRPNLALHHEVTEDAAAFADVISWAFKPSDGRTEEPSDEEEGRLARADLASESAVSHSSGPGTNRERNRRR